MTLQAEIYESNSTTYTRSLYQHDKNVTLVFDGLNLPEKYEVHFSNQKDSGISIACQGDASGVLIPDALLSTGDYIYAWVCDADEATGTNGQYMVVIPVIPRPVPVPMQIIHDGQAEMQYEIHADDEDLTFTSIPTEILNPVVEGEN